MTKDEKQKVTIVVEVDSVIYGRKLLGVITKNWQLIHFNMEPVDKKDKSLYDNREVI